MLAERKKMETCKQRVGGAAGNAAEKFGFLS